MAKDPKKRNLPRSQKIPEKVLDEVLGKEKANYGKKGSRDKMKKSMVKEGRKDSGQKNPRRGYSGRTLEEQVKGSMGQLGPMNVQDKILQQMGIDAGMMNPNMDNGIQNKAAYAQAIAEFIKMEGRPPTTLAEFAHIDSLLGAPAPVLSEETGYDPGYESEEDDEY